MEDFLYFPNLVIVKHVRTHKKPSQLSISIVNTICQYKIQTYYMPETRTYNEPKVNLNSLIHE